MAAGPAAGGGDGDGDGGGGGGDGDGADVRQLTGPAEMSGSRY